MTKEEFINEVHAIASNPSLVPICSDQEFNIIKFVYRWYPFKTKDSKRALATFYLEHGMAAVRNMFKKSETLFENHNSTNLQQKIALTSSTSVQ